MGARLESAPAQGANAKNMTYMLSAQLAAMYLNTELGYVNRYNSYVYTPGCGFLGNGNFMNVNSLIWYSSYYLWYFTTVTGKDLSRDYVECLKNSFANANNNLTFVQPHPCGGTGTDKRPVDQINIISPSTEAKVWPNPSSNYFTLRPSNMVSNEMVQIRVMDINGKQVFAANGNANKDYRFGDKFSPGLYFVEIIQGSNRTTTKLIKQ